MQIIVKFVLFIERMNQVLKTPQKDEKHPLQLHVNTFPLNQKDNRVLTIFFFPLYNIIMKCFGKKTFNIFSL